MAIPSSSLTDGRWCRCGSNSKAYLVRVPLLKFLACLWWTLCWVGSVHAASVVIVVSEQSAGYVQVSDALLMDLERAGTARGDVRLLALADSVALDRAVAERPRVLITLGAEALKQVLSRDVRSPVIAALIPKMGFERILGEAAKKTPLVSALYLDQPFGRQLDLLRLAIPGVKRVGVMWGPESIAQQRNLTSAMQAQGLDPVYGTVGADGVLFAGLKAALEDADVLLAVADPQVFNSATISNILLATYRARIPVMAFSPAYVKAGALLSLYTTPSQIGLQAAAMARQALQGSVVPASQYPQDYVVNVNEYVARSLGIRLDGATLTDRLHRMEKRP